MPSTMNTALHVYTCIYILFNGRHFGHVVLTSRHLGHVEATNLHITGRDPMRTQLI